MHCLGSSVIKEKQSIGNRSVPGGQNLICRRATTQLNALLLMSNRHLWCVEPLIKSVVGVKYAHQAFNNALTPYMVG